jgi:hypothetical protein
VTLTGPAGLGPLLAEAGDGARFILETARDLRQPASLARAHANVAQRRRERSTSFLVLLQRGVYQHPSSPYLALLRVAGIELGDVQRLVQTEGLEGALGVLLDAGVYLSLDELKGRRPARRGSATVPVPPGSLLNPLVRSGVRGRSGGSSGAPTSVPITAAHAHMAGQPMHLVEAAQGGASWARACWYVPGGAALVALLKFATGPSYPERWFSQLPLAAPALHPRYRLSAYAVRLAGFLAGRAFPAPEYAPPSEPVAVVHWLRDTLVSGRTPYLATNVSAALRACALAADQGVSLVGAYFSIGGEPLTSRRLAMLRASGATVTPYYAAMEAVNVATGCLAPEAPDDLHLLDEVNALIQPGEAAATAEGLFPDSLLFTALRPTAPLILLNASLGDVGQLSRRACGCLVDQLGWKQHLHTIRNPQKMTAAGMTFLDTDLARVLDEVLPARFGGGPTDYQLVEQEDPGGQSCLRLLVSPRVGTPDLAQVKEAFLATISAGSGAERVMGSIWRDADLLRVEQRQPQTGFSGKILHLHQAASSLQPVGR